MSPCVECKEVAGVIMCPKLHNYSYKPPCLSSKCNFGKYPSKFRIKQDQIRKVICTWLSKIAARNPKNLILFLKVVTMLAKKQRLKDKENPEDLANVIEIMDTNDPVEAINPNDKKVVRDLFKDEPSHKKLKKHHKKKKNKNKKKKNGKKKYKKKKIVEKEHVIEDHKSTPNEEEILEDESGFGETELTTNAPFSINQPIDINQDEEKSFSNQNKFQSEIDTDDNKANENHAINIQYVQTQSDNFPEEDMFDTDTYEIETSKNTPKRINLVTHTGTGEEFDRGITNSRFI